MHQETAENDHRGSGQDRRWRQMVHVISAMTMDRNASPLIHAEMRRVAALSLLELDPYATADLPAELLLPKNARLKYVAEYVHEHAHLPITSTDLGTLANLSRRAPQTAFGRLLRLSTNACICQVRLDRINADSVTTNVADDAA